MATQDISVDEIYLTPWWDESFRELPYEHFPFNNSTDVESWVQNGYNPHLRFTGDLYDMRNPEPAMISRFRDLLPMKYFSWAFYRMRPGDILPKHGDTYVNFCRIHNIDNIKSIRRYLVFLEDWRSGHYLEIAGRAITGWRAGQVVFWHGDTSHIAANIGMQDRYTLQLTGVVV